MSDVKNGLASDIDFSPGQRNVGVEMVVVGHFRLVHKTDKCYYFQGVDKNEDTLPMLLPKSQTITALLDEENNVYAVSIPRWLAGAKVAEGHLNIQSNV